MNTSLKVFCKALVRPVSLVVFAATVGLLGATASYGYFGNGDATTVLGRVAVGVGTLKPPTNVTADPASGSSVSWADSTTAGAAVEPQGYYVTRTNMKNDVTSAACGTNSTSLTPATAASCSGSEGPASNNQPVPTGTYTYKVTAVYNSWSATASAAPVTVHAPTHFVLTADTTSPVAGAADALTITAKDASNATVKTYEGDKTLTFSGAAPFASFQPTVSGKGGTGIAFGTAETITFTDGVATATGADNGVMTLYEAGPATIGVTDGTISDSGLAVNVVPAAAESLSVSGFLSPTTAGDSHQLTVAAIDGYSNIATGYTGTVTLTSPDAQAGLPANYTFTTGAGGDNGLHPFPVTLNSVGTQSITVTDTAKSSLTGTQSAIEVTQAAPSITAQPSAGVTVGGVVTDTATLTGAAKPSGNVAFTLYSDSTCTTSVGSSSNAVSGTSATSSDLTPTAPGTYYWQASYSDANNALATTTCGAETVVVSQATPSIATSPSPGAPAGDAVSDTATLTGAVNPTGTMLFTLYGDSTCTGAATGGSSVVTVTGGSTVSSSELTPGAGTYYWQAAYSGDANNAAVTGTCDTVVVSAPVAINAAQTTGDGQVAFVGTNATGTTNPVTVTVCSDNPCTTPVAVVDTSGANGKLNDNGTWMSQGTVSGKLTTGQKYFAQATQPGGGVSAVFPFTSSNSDVSAILLGVNGGAPATGKVQAGDNVSVTFDVPLDASTICTGFTAGVLSTDPQTVKGVALALGTETTSGNTFVSTLSDADTACPGLGIVGLASGASEGYVSNTKSATFSGSTVTWTPTVTDGVSTGGVLTITLGTTSSPDLLSSVPTGPALYLIQGGKNSGGSSPQNIAGGSLEADSNSSFTSAPRGW